MTKALSNPFIGSKAVRFAMRSSRSSMASPLVKRASFSKSALPILLPKKILSESQLSVDSSELTSTMSVPMARLMLFLSLHRCLLLLSHVHLWLLIKFPSLVLVVLGSGRALTGMVPHRNGGRLMLTLVRVQPLPILPFSGTWIVRVGPL